MAGGYQAPANPAPVSGPGALSQRTDGGPSQPRMQLPDAAYGEQAAFQEAQGAAPMAADPGMPSGPPVPGLMGPTARPDEPLTAGVPVGPGPNSIAGGGNVFQQDMQMLSKYLPSLQRQALQKGAPRSFQLFVEHLSGNRPV